MTKAKVTQKTLVVSIEVRVTCRDFDVFEPSRILEACRETGSAEVIDMRIEDVTI